MKRKEVKTFLNDNDLMPTKEECWEELNSALDREELLSSYNLLEKKKKSIMFFYRHPASLGEYPRGNYISICINHENIEWEIYLKKDGTWSLI